MPTLDHIHTYVFYKKSMDGKTTFMKCDHPLCTHFSDTKLIVGKLTKCPFCGTDFILTTRDLRLVRPRCVNCSKSKEAVRMRTEISATSNAAVSEMLEDILGRSAVTPVPENKAIKFNEIYEIDEIDEKEEE